MRSRRIPNSSTEAGGSVRPTRSRSTSNRRAISRHQKKTVPVSRDRITTKFNLEHDLRLNLTDTSGRQALSERAVRPGRRRCLVGDLSAGSSQRFARGTAWSHPSAVRRLEVRVVENVVDAGPECKSNPLRHVEILPKCKVRSEESRPAELVAPLRREQPQTSGRLEVCRVEALAVSVRAALLCIRGSQLYRRVDACACISNRGRSVGYREGQSAAGDEVLGEYPASQNSVRRTVVEVVRIGPDPVCIKLVPDIVVGVAVIVCSQAQGIDLP